MAAFASTSSSSSSVRREARQHQQQQLRDDDEDSRATALRPGRRGEQSCLCSGHIQEVKSDGAWLLPHHEIDHVDAWKHRGSIFLEAVDLFTDTIAKKGDSVVFYLFANENGLGAEDCRLKSTFIMKISEAPLWLLDESDGEEDLETLCILQPKKRKTTSDTDSTGFASEEESSSSDHDSCEEQEQIPCCEPCGPTDLLSKGLALHASGLCKPCSFFLWDCCSKGEDCGLCHESHESRFSAYCEDGEDAEREPKAESGPESESDLDYPISSAFSSAASRSRASSLDACLGEESDEEAALCQEECGHQTIAEAAPRFAAMLLQQFGTPPGLERIA